MLRSLPQHSTNKIILVLRFSSLLFLFSSLSVHGYPSNAHIFIYAGCSQEKYQPNSPFEAYLNSLLASAVSSSSQVLYNSFVIGNGSSIPQESTIYGLYQCRGDLRDSDCSKCIESTVNQIGLVCPYSYGGSLQLDGCYLRYERVDFLGKLDTGVRYRRCSKAASNDDEFFRRRDDVLADLQSASGFRVSSSGLVQGFAQCLGDLSAADCSSCLAYAVGMLKSLCGSAAVADVFLGQCYARYWESGYYDDFSSDSSKSKNDQMGKSVAIIVGAVVGLAIIVVVLSVCRRTMEKSNVS